MVVAIPMSSAHLGNNHASVKTCHVMPSPTTAIDGALIFYMNPSKSHHTSYASSQSMHEVLIVDAGFGAYMPLPAWPAATSSLVS